MKLHTMERAQYLITGGAPNFALIFLKCPARCRELHFSWAPEPPSSRPSPAGNLGFYTSNHSLRDLICNCIRRTDWLETISALYSDRFFFYYQRLLADSVNSLSSPRPHKYCSRHFVLPVIAIAVCTTLK